MLKYIKHSSISYFELNLISCTLLSRAVQSRELSDHQEKLYIVSIFSAKSAALFKEINVPAGSLKDHIAAN